MALRSWAIRGILLAGVAAVAALGWLANSWVSPERVRSQVVARLAEEFANTQVHVGSARLRLFGGIAVSDIRLTRLGDEAPFLVVPSAVLFHDKEQLNRGRLVIKKIELERPELRIERGSDGRWSLADVVRPGPPDKPIPTFVIRAGTVHVTDRSPDPLPPLTLTDAHLTLLNDPLPVLAVQLRAGADGFGPVAVRARLNRLSQVLSLALEMPQFPLGEVAPVAAERFAPELTTHLTGLQATAAVSADLTYAPGSSPGSSPGSPPRLQYDVRVALKEARFTHPSLPWPVEKVTATARASDGRLKVEDATAEVNGAKVRFSFETRPGQPLGNRHTVGTAGPDTAAGRSEPAGPSSGPSLAAVGLCTIEDYLQRAEFSATEVLLDDTLFDQLPADARDLRRQFSPVGRIDVGYRFVREPGGWKRELEVRPKQLAVTYEKFKYPVTDLRGWVKRADTPDGPPTTAIDLIGTAGGQFITIKGQIVGPGPDPGINLRVSGANVPMDETLLAAIPPRYVEMVRRFRASGRGDFVAEIVQQPGVNLCENEFRIDIRDATINHTEFPYPLEKVKGRLVVRTTVSDPRRPVHPAGPPGPPPDRDEVVLDSFTALHAGAAVWLNGSKRPIPNSRDHKITLHVGGNNAPVDADLRAALAALNIESVWTRFQPRGRITFSADIELLDRAGPVGRPDLAPKVNPATDLRLTFSFSGPTITPNFLPYEVTDLSGWLEYKNGRVDIAHFAGRHGESRVRLAAGEVRIYPDGAIWANLGGLEVKPFLADADLIAALPARLGSALEALQVRGGAELTVKHLVLLTPPAVARPEPPPGASPVTAPHPGPDATVYWDAELRLAGASLDTGVSWEQVFGAVSCRGRYEGDHMGLIRGAVWLDRAVIAKLPVSRLSCRVRAAAQKPDPVRPGDFLPTELEFTDLTGDLFHGTLGGEARVTLSDPVRFDLWLTATDVQLDEVARHYKLGSDADLKGIAQAQVRLAQRPDPRTGQLVLDGSGKIDVPTGRMYNLPVLLDLVKVLKLQTPDKTAFEEAHATFRIHGDRIKVEQVDLIGKAVCLGGSGELDTSGDYVKFDFYTVGSQVLARMINTPVGDLTAFLSKNLFVIRMTRENGELKYKPEAVPLVTEPVRAVADRLRARAARMFGGGGR